ncbi:hypothetical protein [Planctomicrobium piriforme]|uniref:hypothetical protein n=1 Tax=Planctomicrobium piriforme TaxID=1576369 RepID=UPI0011135A87|nr:hypothetical protein [Planctomicrobium piriforme]
MRELPADQHPPQTLGDVLRICLLQAMAEEYVDDRHWGGTVERFDGFRFRGLNISKRERLVNDGFWHRYKARLIRPGETLQVQVRQEAGPDNTVRFAVEMILRAQCEATFAWWSYGVKGWNGTAVSEATLRLRLVLDTQPQFQFSLDTPIPGLALNPKVSEIELKLKDLDLQRLGVFEGPGVTVLGDGSRKAIEQLLQQQEGKLKQRLQQQIDAVGTRQ